MWAASILSQSRAYLFNLLTQSFIEQTFLVLMKSSFLIFLLWIMTFCDIENSSPRLRSQKNNFYLIYNTAEIHSV